jgi:CRP/FNR family transcriptional regulator, cyclic AMP receptor protein
MPPRKKEPLNLKFPHGEHEDCRALTEITIDNLPSDDALGTVLKFPRGAFVWQPDDRADKLYFLKTGRIGIAGIDRDGSEVILAIIVGGEPFGELCFCGGVTERRNSIARATAASIALEITVEDFVAYMRQTEEILGKFLFTICIRLAHAERRIGILAMRGVEARLGHALLHLAQTRGVPVGSNRAGELKLAVTHEELAGMTALSRQRVTIMMNRFRQLGLIQYARTQPLIINIITLEKYLQESI